MRFSLHDGPGIRTTVFLKGCPLNCRWCHNPESQSHEPELINFDERCIHCGDCAAGCPHGALHLDQRLTRDPELCQRCGECVQACPSGARQLAGRWMTVPEVLTEVLKDEVFFDESRGGVTISGGEPLFQAGFVEALLAACHARRIRTALDTCGFADPGVMRRVSEHVDLFLYDLKLMDSEKHQRYTGVKNDVILQNLKMLAERGSHIIVRVPVIPGVNDDRENFGALSEYLSSLGLKDIDLLPYHRLGSDKYLRLHMLCGMEEIDPPTTEQMETIASRLRRDGFHVRIGG
ncbi:MAG TPA: glycyl-radical enzyme activating protein [Terracidiphilus sp.]|jgi:pyruvate formate lyase activating enzyme|nr:glycyl-radical enzyme activating protein [Terracidiphilus sp.]